MSHCTDSKVQPVSGDQSLFDPATIEEIDIRDFIVLKDEAGMVVGIVTAADLATRFERFGKAFALVGEIELRLRHFVERNLSAEEICGIKRKPRLDFTEEDSSTQNKNFRTYAKVFYYLSEVPCRSVDTDQLAKDILAVRLIRNRLMHFDSGALEEATVADIETLQDILEEVRKLE